MYEDPPTISYKIALQEEKLLCVFHTILMCCNHDTDMLTEVLSLEAIFL